MERNKRQKLFLGASIFFFLMGLFVTKIPFDKRLSWISSLFVIVFALPTYVCLYKWIGGIRSLILLIILGIFAFVIETFSIKTGFPYSKFTYTEKMAAYKLFGLVPWTLPFAWTPLVLGSMGLASTFTKKPIKLVFISALILVIIDLILDPGAIALDFWRWEQTGFFYKVPTINFLGWFLSGSIGSLIVYLFTKNELDKENKYPIRLTYSLFFILIFWTAVVLFSGLIIPFFIGIGLLIYLQIEIRKSLLKEK